ncbi:protein of unknown function [Taphrina deformans PYCC 5710]|uniref:Uncharacterized protein n=1 Tax=Taphrina deformans (strain PYCC 5710 / ATCC 11124 / CBS 356.35 / IMI 108563 / JCM 9778 / NBRC 8474) TaxID=1097556 RepID=R4XHW7_TAPDE|nr:protein of unknown function [Taphrina deformans PYCC 5710]|eukprot:CCG83002.1 protein of unknown function [Taphrina deformans PYCC 5710]
MSGEPDSTEGTSGSGRRSPTQNSGIDSVDTTSTIETGVEDVGHRTFLNKSALAKEPASQDYFHDTVEDLDSAPVDGSKEPSNIGVDHIGDTLVSKAASTQDFSLCDKAPSTSAEVKKIPGWKGWLRSASSSNANVFRLDLKRRTISTESQVKTVLSVPESAGTILPAFNAIKLNAKDNDHPMWHALSDVVQSTRPKELLESSQILRLDFPDALRGLLWQHVSNSKNTDLESVFLDLKTDVSAQSTKQIQKDLQRMSKSWVKKLDKNVSELE